MQALASRRMLQTNYSVSVGMRLALLSSSRAPMAFRIGSAFYANPSPFAIRTASTSSGSSVEGKTHTFVIWAPDYTDKDALARRLAVREKHLHETKPGQESGYYCELFIAVICLRLTPLQCSVVLSLPRSR